MMFSRATAFSFRTIIALLGSAGALIADSTVVFNEIMYHPFVREAELEWVELHNQMAVDVDISGWLLGDGVFWVFEEGTIVPGGGYLVVAISPAALAAETGYSGALGPFAGRLSNSGERLDLLDRNGRVMDSVRYETGGDWPVSPDGSGVSLAKVDEADASDRADNWASSGRVGGTPGRENFPSDDGGSPPDPGREGLVSWWSLDEASGQALDAAGGNHGTLGSGARRTAGLAGAGAIDFDNTVNAFVNVGSGAGNNFSVTSGITIEAVVVLDWSGAAGDYDEVFRKEDGSDRILFSFQNDGTTETRDVAISPAQQPVLSFGLNAGGIYSELDMPLDGQAGRPSLAGLRDGSPHHIAATYDRATGLKSIWIDGAFAFGADLGGGGSVRSGGATSAYIGNMAGRGEPFTGVIDEVAFWSRALSSEEIADHAAAALSGADYFSGPGEPPAGPAAALAFNEVLQSPGGSWIELINHGAAAIELEGWVVAVHGVVAREHVLAAERLVAGARLVLAEDDLGFGLADGDRLFLYSPDRRSVADGARVRPGLRGRLPEGSRGGRALGEWSRRWLFPDQPTPGEANSFAFDGDVVINEVLYHQRGLPPTPPVLDETLLIPLESVWRYDASGAGHTGSAWRQPGFDDAAWDEGRALLYNESAALPAPKNTELPLGATTYYFRTDFELAAGVEGTDLVLRPIIDDGAVFYLNGAELLRLNMPEGPIDPSTLASVGVGDATFSSPLTAPAAALRAGRNVLAVEVHQRTTNSSDIVFGLELRATAVVVPGQPFRESPESWIELLNRSPAAKDLSGWKIDGGVRYTFPAGTTIPANGYLLIAGDQAHLRALYPELAILGDLDGRLSNRSDLLLLLDAAGNPADEVRYFDDGRWPSYADGGGSSLELRDPRADNSRAEAWAASDESGRASWRTYSYREIATANIGPTQWRDFCFGLLEEGEVLIDDIRVVESPGGAPRELVGNGNFQSGTSGWRLLGNHSRSRVIADPEAPGNSVLHLVATGPTEHMHNHVETTLLGGISVVNGREYEVSFRARWVAGSNQLHTRLYFNRVPETTLLDLPDRSGTPGAVNSAFEPNIGPTFSGFGHLPVTPASGEPVTVSASADDPDGVAWVRLWYSVAGGAWASVPMEPGAGGLLAAEVPGQSAARTVQIYVEAEDARGARSTFPAGGRDSRALYRVEDGQARLGTLHNFRIIMTQPDTDLLYTTTNLMSDDRLGCTVVVDESRAFYDVGVRLRGSERGRPDPRRVSFNVRFHADRLFRGVHRTVSVDRSGGWSPLVPVGSQDEILLKHAANHAGAIPSMYDDIVRVIAPQSAHTGYALLLMARYGGVYLDAQYEDGGDGTTYKLELIYYPTTATVDGYKLPQPDGVLGADIADHGDDKEVYRWNFLIDSNRDRDDYSGLIALCKSFSLPASQLEAGTHAVMDVDQWMRAFALYSLGGVNDTYTFGNNHNNIYYIRPSDGRAMVFPWDMDFCFTRGTNASLWGDQNLRRVIEIPGNTRRFYAHLRDIIETTYNTSYMSRWTSHYGSLTATSFASVLNYIGQRASFVLSRMPAAVPFEITSNGGAAFSVNAPSVVLEGRAGIDVQFIVVADIDEELPIVWSSLSDWAMTVPLEPGRNDLSLLGFDVAGELTASDRIVVTSTFALPPPALTSVEPAEAEPGATVTVRGSGFEPGIDVFFAGTPAAAVDFDPASDAGSLRAEVPALPAGSAGVTATNFGSAASNAIAFTVLPSVPRFTRGDANLDGVIDIADPIRILLHLFDGREIGCEDAADADDDEMLVLTDAVVVLEYLFGSGAPPPAPFPEPGLDPTDDGPLGCAVGVGGGGA